MKRLSILILFFVFSLLNSSSYGLPVKQEIIKDRAEMEELTKLEAYTVLVESTLSSQGLAIALVPTVSIVTQNGQKGVLVVGENYEPVFQKVEIGKSWGNKTEVISGIKAGDRIFIDIPPWLR